MKRVVIVGELTLDDVIVERGNCDWGQIGGGALYSAIGARLWDVRPEISATVGRDYPQTAWSLLEEVGIDLGSVTVIDGNSLGLWLLYEKGGRRHQVEKESGSTFTELDRLRRPWRKTHEVPDGLHIAPQTAEGQARALAEARGLNILVTQDVLIEPFISLEMYRSGEAIRGTHAFLPSQQEVDQIWGPVDDRELLTKLRDVAGIEYLVITRGELGADVILPDGTRRVPPCNETFKDPTGAGDAFSGGFIAGLMEVGDPVEAAVRGNVSASLVVETSDAVEAIERLCRLDREKRANRLREKVERH